MDALVNAALSVESSPAQKDRNEQVNALDDLFWRSSSYRFSVDCFAILQFISRLPWLSPYNAFLIHMQHPGVQYVATASQWKRRFRRTVKPDARPLVILIPFGPLSFVYDLADTEGPATPRGLLRPFETKGRLNEQFYSRTVENAFRDGICIRESDFGIGLAGYVRHKQGSFSISLNKHHALEDKYSTLAHELGHIYSGHVGKGPKSPWPDRSDEENTIKEFEAESISFLVCRRLGLATTSAEYLAKYVAKHKQFPQFSLETVLTVAGRIERMGKVLAKPEDAAKQKANRSPNPN
jgi:hypothetical protein